MIVFQNKGLIELRTITTFGVSVKPETDNPIGYFGTGLKYAIAVMLREGIKVTLYRGTTKLRFTAKKRKIRGQQFHMVLLNGEELPFTTELGKNWDLWMAYRELAANAMDEPDNIVTSDKPDIKTGYTTFVAEGHMLDAVHNNRDSIFLMTKPKYKFDTVEFHDGPGVGKYIYYKGIRVFELPKQAMYNYNILFDLKLTEDRTLPSLTKAYSAIAKAIVPCDHAGLIRQLLEAHQNYWESTIDYTWYFSTPGETFNAIVKHYIHSGTAFNSTAKTLHKNNTNKVPAPKTVQWETIPMVNRRKLWAALQFWAKLGVGIPRESIRVTDELGKASKGTMHEGTIYLSLHVLDRDMRQVAGIIYSLWARQKHKGAKDENSLLIDTIVDFGERILGLKERNAA